RGVYHVLHSFPTRRSSDLVYILGCNEGSLPKITAGSTFIPDSIRRAHGLPVLENQDALSAYLFYRLLHTPQRITLVYNQVIDDRSEEHTSELQSRENLVCR